MFNSLFQFESLLSNMRFSLKNVDRNVVVVGVFQGMGLIPGDWDNSRSLPAFSRPNVTFWGFSLAMSCFILTVPSHMSSLFPVFLCSPVFHELISPCVCSQLPRLCSQLSFCVSPQCFWDFSQPASSVYVALIHLCVIKAHFLFLSSPSCFWVVFDLNLTFELHLVVFIGSTYSLSHSARWGRPWDAAESFRNTKRTTFMLMFLCWHFVRVNKIHHICAHLTSFVHLGTLTKQ